MPQGDKSKYTDKQKRQAEHIEDGYKESGVSDKEAAARAWATVNRQDHGGKKPGGSGRGTEPATHPNGNGPRGAASKAGSAKSTGAAKKTGAAVSGGAKATGAATKTAAAKKTGAAKKTATSKVSGGKKASGSRPTSGKKTASKR